MNRTTTILARRLATVLLLLLPAALHAQEIPTREPTRLPPAWQQWRPYEPAPAPDTLALPLTPPGVRALGAVPPTRWLTVDPMADEYPAWSPYNYVLNNPLLYTDPDGRRVRTETEEEAQQLVEDIGQLYGGAPVGYARVTTTKTVTLFGIKLWSSDETYYEITVDGSSDFDWGQDQYASALYDAIASEDVTFNVMYQETAPIMGGGQQSLLAAGGGFFDRVSSREANVYVHPQGNPRVGDPSSIMLMHEMIGHGHPVATPRTGNRNNAHDINRFYHQRLGITPRAGYQSPHTGYNPVRSIQWPQVGLYRR